MPYPPHDSGVQLVPYDPARRNDIDAILARRRRRGPVLAFWAVVGVASIGIGYGAGSWQTRRLASTAGEAETGEIASLSGAAQLMPPDDEAPAAAPTDTAEPPLSVEDVLRQADEMDARMAREAPPQPAVYAADFEGLEADTFPRRMLVPPEEPPAYIAPPVPPSPVIASMLYGQRLTARTLLGDYHWKVEPGEMVELTVDQVWDDPEAISSGVRITFVVMAHGKGMRASGLLRYFRGEGETATFRDFTPSSVVRVGSW